MHVALFYVFWPFIHTENGAFPPPETLFCVYMWTRKTRILACNVKLVHLHLLFQCQTVSHFIALTGPPMATIGQHLYTARP